MWSDNSLRNEVIMKRFMGVTLCAVMALSLLTAIPAEAAKKPKLNKSKVSLYVGKSTTLRSEEP